MSATQSAEMESATTLELEMMKTAQSLEWAYTQALQDINTTLFQEETRRLRVQNVLMEHESDELQQQLLEEDDRHESSEREMEDMRQALDEAEANSAQVQADLRAKSRELNLLRAELKATQESSATSTKLMTEKFALAHELANLKPEVDHLRAQLASHQAVVSEKLALQRQLSTLQVELETEKRAAQRVMRKEAEQPAVDPGQEKVVEGLRKDLAKEKREREKVEKEAKKTSAEWEARRAVLESKLEAMRTKLRTTKEQLKETKEQLQQAQTAAAAAEASSRAAPAVANPRKRSASQMDHDQIGTPDGMAVKRRGSSLQDRRVSTVPGEKSAFSITPFLSRTSLAPESPKEAQGEVPPSAAPTDGKDDAEGPASPSVVRPKATKKSTTASKGSRQETKVLAASKANARPPDARKRAARSTLENVVEENEENEAAAEPARESIGVDKEDKSQGKQGKRLTFLPLPGEDVEPKKKKRKMLSGGAGKTLFDDEDGEATKPVKTGLGSQKGFPSWIKGGLGKDKAGSAAALSAAPGFGAFSPLKKDRRAGVGK